MEAIRAANKAPHPHTQTPPHTNRQKIKRRTHLTTPHSTFDGLDVVPQDARRSSSQGRQICSHGRSDWPRGAGKLAGRKLIDPVKVVGILPRRSLWRSCRIAWPRWRGGGTNKNVATEEIVEGTKRMAISGACACVGVTTGAA